jgi:hypothetical protein
VSAAHYALSVDLSIYVVNLKWLRDPNEVQMVLEFVECCDLIQHAMVTCDKNKKPTRRAERVIGSEGRVPPLTEYICLIESSSKL